MLNTQKNLEENNTNENNRLIDILETENKADREITESENNLIDEIRNFMDGKLRDKTDLSYDWIIKEPNILLINKSIEADSNQINGVMLKRDFGCELKVNNITNCIEFLFIFLAFKINNRR
jgi:hypothetical protein